jgi:hypothetical protein
VTVALFFSQKQAPARNRHNKFILSVSIESCFIGLMPMPFKSFFWLLHGVVVEVVSRLEQQQLQQQQQQRKKKNRTTNERSSFVERMLSEVGIRTLSLSIITAVGL